MQRMRSLRNYSRLVWLLWLALLPSCKKGPKTARASQVAVGLDHACALLQTGLVECWGLDDRGQLGERKAAASPEAGPDAAAVDAGSTASGGDAGIEGGVVLPVKPPAQVDGLVKVTTIAAGGSSSCALFPNGDVRCWGDNSQGQLGPGKAPGGFSRTLLLVDGVQNATSVAMGPTHSCALEQDGTVVCWGLDDAGQLGDPGNPVQGATAVAVGLRHSCAVVNGGVVCWGDNTIGQLGAADGNPVAPLGGVVGIAAGGNESCALRSDGSVLCWGSLDPKCTGGCGQAPAQVSLPGAATKLAIGLVTACALMEDGSIECWDKTGAATFVRGITGASDFDLGAGSGCAVLSDASVACWGDNTFGQLGDGTTAKHSGLVKLEL